MNGSSSGVGTSLCTLVSVVSIFGVGCTANEPPEQLFLNLPALPDTVRDATPTPRQIAEALEVDDRRRAASRALDVDFRETTALEGWMCRGSDQLRIAQGLLQVPPVETCRLRWRVSALARDFTHLAIRLAKTPRGSANSEFRVSWRQGPEDAFDPDQDAVAPYGPEGWIIVPFGGPHWNGSLYELLFNPGQVDGIQIASIRGFHVGDLLEPAVAGPAGFDRAHVELLRMRRSALRIPPSSALRQRVRIVAGDQLRFGFGMHPLTSDLASSATRFEIRIQADGVAERTKTFVLPNTTAPLKHGWRDAAIPLDEFAGREVTIRFTTTPVEQQRPTGIPLWSEPRIANSGRAKRGPNLLLISIDTLRPDHLESYGYAHATSPSVSRLAREGVRFEECLSHAPSTLPSHSALFTGIPSYRVPLLGRRLPAVHDTLAEILRREGFATAAFVGGAYFDPRFGLAQGFETYSYAKIDHAATSAYDYSDIAFNTRRALSWLKRNRDRRFFLFFHTYEVHSPFTPRQRYIDRFLPENAEPPLASIEMRSNSRAKPLEPPWTGWKNYVDSPGSAKTLSQTGIARIRAIYDSEIRATDSYLEKLLGELERDNLLDNTVVVFTSDHGEAFFEHGRVGHGHLYADNLRVPLILRFPAQLPANAVVEERVQLADVVPTCLELLGVRVPAGVDGVSLVSRLTRDEPLPERAVISTGHIAGISYVTPSGGKLIAPLLADHAVGHPQYFELETDPDELDDRYPELDTVRVAQLRREVAVVLEQFHGLHFVFSPRAPSRFEGSLSLAGPKRSLNNRLRVFPLEHGWLSIDDDGDARVATGWFDRWWLHLGPQHGRFTITGRLIDKDGHAVEIDRSFSLGSDSAGEPIPAAGAAEHSSALRAFAVTLDGNAASEAPLEPDIPAETRRQLELLGYAD